MPVAPLYDVIVIGLGAMGSATLDHLARRGVNVLGLEQFGIPHEHGSSGGDTRLIRKAYFEHPDYVPLLQRAYANWDDLGARTGERVLYRTGAVYVGRPDSELIAGSLASAQQHSLPCDRLSGEEVTRRWSGLRVPAGYDALHERGRRLRAGRQVDPPALRVRVAARRARAGRRSGARMARDRVRRRGGYVRRNLSRRAPHRNRWQLGRRVLPRLGTPLEVTRQALFWVWPAHIGAVRTGHVSLLGSADSTDTKDSSMAFRCCRRAWADNSVSRSRITRRARRWNPAERRPVDAAEFASVREALREIFVRRPGTGRRDESVHVHLHHRRPLRRGPISRERARDRRVRIQRPRLQVRVGHRRSAGGPRARRSNGIADRIPGTRTVSRQTGSAPGEQNVSGGTI